MNHYLDFTKSYPIEDLNGGFLVSDNGEAQSIPFAAFFSGVILSDDRWGKTLSTLESLVDLRTQFKELSYIDSSQNKTLVLTNEQFDLCLQIIENPQLGYNVQFAPTIHKHIIDLKRASTTPLTQELA